MNHGRASPGRAEGRGCSLVAVRLCQSNVVSLENVFPVPYSIWAARPGQGSSSTQEIDTKCKICAFCFPRTRGPAETPQKRLLCAAQLDNSPEKTFLACRGRSDVTRRGCQQLQTEHTAASRAGSSRPGLPGPRPPPLPPYPQGGPPTAPACLPHSRPAVSCVLHSLHMGKRQPNPTS